MAVDEQRKGRTRIAKTLKCVVAKVDTTLGVVFGYAIICEKSGEPYFDTQRDHIPPETMLESMFEYMSGNRVAKDYHDGPIIGHTVFGFPLTQEIADSLGITVEKTGFIIGMRPRHDILAKYASGERRDFSIGGICEEYEEV